MCLCVCTELLSDPFVRLGQGVASLQLREKGNSFARSHTHTLFLFCILLLKKSKQNVREIVFMACMFTCLSMKGQIINKTWRAVYTTAHLSVVSVSVV